MGRRMPKRLEREKYPRCDNCNTPIEDGGMNVGRDGIRILVCKGYDSIAKECPRQLA